MRPYSFAIGIFLLLCSCSDSRVVVQVNGIKWLGEVVHQDALIPRMNQYVMKDSTGTRVGSMSFTFLKDQDKWMAIDTSQFDDGSIYETANMIFDLETEAFSNLKTRIDVPNANMLVDLENVQNRITGVYQVNKDSIPLVNRQLDSAYRFDVFREEIYMMLHSILIEPGDSLTFNMFLSNSLSVVPSSIYYERQERIKVEAGEFDCTVVYLNTGGVIDNRIWIGKAPDRRLVKFHVPGPKLDIELVSSVSRLR